MMMLQGFKNGYMPCRESAIPLTSSFQPLLGKDLLGWGNLTAMNISDLGQSSTESHLPHVAKSTTPAFV